MSVVRVDGVSRGGFGAGVGFHVHCGGDAGLVDFHLRGGGAGGGAGLSGGGACVDTVAHGDGVVRCRSCCAVFSDIRCVMGAF